MERTSDETGWSGRDTAREFVYAVPAALVMFVHALVALIAIGGVIIGVDGLEGTSTALYRLLIPLAALLAASAAIALSAALWSRSSWWILAVPACTLPGLVIAGFTYMAISWSH